MALIQEGTMEREIGKCPRAYEGARAHSAGHEWDLREDRNGPFSSHLRHCIQGVQGQ